VWDAEEEARNISADIDDLHRQGHAYHEMAVLVRASFQMREFEDRFLANAIPYKVIGGPRFYERAEIRDALAYLRVIAQGDDDLAFERIVNKPKRGIGEAAVQALHNYARAAKVPLSLAAEMLGDTEDVAPKARRSLADLAASFARWRQQAATLPHAELAEIVLDESGYTDALKADKSPEAPGRLENLKELVRSMEQYESLTAFLEHVSLVMELEQNESGDRVNLMTLHAAKGLEFETVFLPGWEEGLFPSQRTLDEKGTAGLEEERRLAYVGITRAKRRARVSFAANRRVRGTWGGAMPSRFVGDLPADHIENIADQGFYGAYGGFRDNAGGGALGGDYGSTYDSPGWRRAQARKKEAEGFAEGYRAYRAGPEPGSREYRRAAAGLSPRGPVIDGTARTVSTAEPASTSAFELGERVFHQKFGYGRIVAIEGNKLLVDFEKAGSKRVMDNFVQST
jgi:DNA helicase-2/ATP-dependent DNA helicase PcrA